MAAPVRQVDVGTDAAAALADLSATIFGAFVALRQKQAQRTHQADTAPLAGRAGEVRSDDPLSISR